MRLSIGYLILKKSNKPTIILSVDSVSAQHAYIICILYFWKILIISSQVSVL